MFGEPLFDQSIVEFSNVVIFAAIIPWQTGWSKAQLTTRVHQLFVLLSFLSGYNKNIKGLKYVGLCKEGKLRTETIESCNRVVMQQNHCYVIRFLSYYIMSNG